MKKKITAIILAMVLVLSLGACGDTSELSGFLNELQEIGNQIEEMTEDLEGVDGLAKFFALRVGDSADLLPKE